MSLRTYPAYTLHGGRLDGFVLFYGIIVYTCVETICVYTKNLVYTYKNRDPEMEGGFGVMVHFELVSVNEDFSGLISKIELKNDDDCAMRVLWKDGQSSWHTFDIKEQYLYSS